MFYILDLEWEGYCADQTYQWTKSETLKSRHSWGEIYKYGVSYAQKASISLEGIGVSSTVTFSADMTQSYGGFHETDQTVSSTTVCTAKPGTVVTCQYIAYKGKIKIGYTIYWKNATPTRGVYEGYGWKSHLITKTRKLHNY